MTALDNHMGLVIVTAITACVAAALALCSRWLLRRKHPLAAFLTAQLTLAGLIATLVLGAVFIFSVGQDVLNEFNTAAHQIQTALARHQARH